MDSFSLSNSVAGLSLTNCSTVFTHHIEHAPTVTAATWEVLHSVNSMEHFTNWPHAMTDSWENAIYRVRSEP